MYLCRFLFGIAIISLGVGCSQLRLKSYWMDGGRHGLVDHKSVHPISAHVLGKGLELGQVDWLGMASRRFRDAEYQSILQNSDCVDGFSASALWNWQAIAECSPVAGESDDPRRAAAIDGYNGSLARLIYEGQKHKRLIPSQSLTIHSAGEQRLLPIEYHGFAWDASDFQELMVVGRYSTSSITNRYSETGIGVPVIVIRRKPSKVPHEGDFLPDTSCFAATAILHPDGPTLTLYNPLVVRTVCVDGRECRLANDLTASVAYALHHHPQTRLQDFLRPDQPSEPSYLYFTEPFQADKIPLILVHGLLSSPDAWTDVYNELRATPGIMDTYQIWAFKYSTGAPFIRSAYALRSQLEKVQSQYDPERENPFLKQGVVVGHSMGGLISKLLISYSGEQVWDAIANIPLETLRTSPEMKARFSERLFFDPHPMASRVVFIATPHQGSRTASRGIGQLASALVVASDRSMEHLLNCNPGAFKDSVSNGFPNSIEMLDPTQPFLAAIDSLHLSDEVPLHTILGTGNLVVGHGRSDGVVTIESAVHKKSQSEVRAATTHNGLLRHSSTFAELKRILALHASIAESTLDQHSTSMEEAVPSGVDPNEAITSESSISLGEETIGAAASSGSIHQ